MPPRSLRILGLSLSVPGSSRARQGADPRREPDEAVPESYSSTIPPSTMID